MGLDQNLYHFKPDIDDPYNTGEDFAYWRKDWDLQGFINAGNCENYIITTEQCDSILTELDSIYADNDHYKEQTREAFTKAKQLVSKGEEVIYHAWW